MKKELVVKEETGMGKALGEYSIIRGEASGVFFGVVTRREGREVELKDCLRIWSWEGACSLSQIALEGVKRPDDCRFTVSVPQIVVLDAIEVIPCTIEAIDNIKSVKVWRSN